MRPILFHLGGVPVYSYIVFVNVAFAACLAYALYEARRMGLPRLPVIDIGLLNFVFGLIGARLLFVIVEYKHFLHDPLAMLKIWQGGLVFYGGLMGAAIAVVIYLKVQRMDLALWADLIAPTAMVTLIFGRLGCFMNGCCYGKVAPDLPWGVVYPLSHPTLGLARLPVHPSPLYESLACLLIFLILAVMLRKVQRRGLVFWTMVLLYGLARFILEFFRGDPRGKVPFLDLSTSQAISIAAVTAAVVFIVRLLSRPLPGPAAPDGAS